MKIACISSSTVPASTANSIQVMKVCQALAQLGHDVRLWVPGKIYTPWQGLSDYYGISKPFQVEWLAAYPSLKRYDFALSALQKAIHWRAELIYSWLPQSALFGLIRGFPIVLEVHDRPKGNLGPRLLRWVIRHKGQKRLAVITRALAKVLESEFNLPIDTASLVIAPDGVDLERYEDLPAPAIARERLNLQPKFTGVYTGHLYPGRGMDLLEGMARELPEMQFLWVGGQPQTVDAWRETVRNTGIDNITLTGFVENKNLALYQAAGDVLLMPYELSVSGSSGGNTADICSPMKMFEYMACGRAIITSDLPVLHEVLNEKNAVFCPPEDLSAWISVIRNLMKNPEAGIALGKQARLDVQKYTWQKRQEKILGG